MTRLSQVTGDTPGTPATKSAASMSIHSFPATRIGLLGLGDGVWLVVAPLLPVPVRVLDGVALTLPVALAVTEMEGVDDDVREVLGVAVNDTSCDVLALGVLLPVDEELGVLDDVTLMDGVLLGVTLLLGVDVRELVAVRVALELEVMDAV